MKRLITMLVHKPFALVVSTCLAGALALACSSSDHPGSGQSDGTTRLTDAGTSSSGGDGGASSSGGGDGGVDGSTPKDAGPPPTGECAGLTKDGATITHQRVAQAAPTPSGGNIVAGKYILTAFTTYTGVGGATGPTGELLNSTMTVTSTMLKVAEADEDGDVPPQALNYTTMGSALNMTFICPSPDTLKYRDYTAQPNALWIFQGNVVRVYTKQ